MYGDRNAAFYAAYQDFWGKFNIFYVSTQYMPFGLPLEW